MVMSSVEIELALGERQRADSLPLVNGDRRSSASARWR